jgi:glycosyltransferase involved in cell wall biosynthesis
LGLPSDKILLLSISTAEKRKNLQVLPKIADALPLQFALVRVGPPVRGAITLSGLSDEAVADLYSACDALLFPTLEEGFGLPVIEAFASGLPVVASDIPPFREIASGAALLVDPTSPAVNTQACLDAIGMRDELRVKGLQRAEGYSLDHLRSRLLSFYSSF